MKRHSVILSFVQCTEKHASLLRIVLYTENVVKMLFAVAIVGVFVLAGCALCLGALCLCFSIPVFHIFKYLLNSKSKARGTDGELIPFFVIMKKIHYKFK